MHWLRLDRYFTFADGPDGKPDAAQATGVLAMIEEIERTGDAEGYVTGVLDRKERLMGFGHRVYRAEDPRARTLRRVARELDAPRYHVAEAFERAALAALMLSVCRGSTSREMNGSGAAM